MAASNFPGMKPTAESARLQAVQAGRERWKTWGPYLSDRQWGTVREDYSADGDAWDYFPHDQAKSRAYRWGEDGLAGFSDDRQRLCLGLALWNGRDPILKERLFGLTNGQGNHGEDVKECYYHLDALPTHAYLKFLYKYPQAEYPYARLVEENRRRGKGELEFELIDTGVFDADRYFDVFVEYALADPEDVLLRVTVWNRGPDAAALHVLPQLWFRNTWTWAPGSARPDLRAQDHSTIQVTHAELGEYWFHAEAASELLFCENETNPRVFGDPNLAGYFKDGFHDYLVQGKREAVNPDQSGTKAAAHFIETIAAGQSRQFRLRLTRKGNPDPFRDFDAVFATRSAEAEAYYEALQAGIEDADARLVQRQALAGMIWSKQYYHYDVREWLRGDPGQPPPPPQRNEGRNSEWLHIHHAQIVSMPDKWEYPWFAAWDLAFHCLPLALVDAAFAKEQLLFLCRVFSMHANGQIPAYEWNFGDVNPPVQAWAAWRVFQIDRKQQGVGDLDFLERIFHKLLLNFMWWVNRKDASGRNIFQGGFLGLDNIGAFDRSRPLPGGGTVNQADGTSWMAAYCLNLMRIALELAKNDAVYEDMATKLFEHFLCIAEAMTNLDGEELGLWDEVDAFYYDELKMPQGGTVTLKLRSMVGLIPLFAVETLEPELLEKLPAFRDALEWYLRHRPELAGLVSRWNEPGRGQRRLLSLLRGHRIKCVLRRMLDPAEFLSPYGIRAVSKVYENAPFTLSLAGEELRVGYVPGESDSGLFGGNSNWRGPVWMPVNYLIIESLQKFHHYFGDDFKVECPTGSGQMLTLNEIATELSGRLAKLFLKDAGGGRPVHGLYPKFHADPHFRDYVWFHEYFHGDSGRGVGASHQTGWTGLIAKLLHPKRAAQH